MSSSASPAATQRFWVRKQLEHLKIRPDEGLVGGRTSGVLWLIGGLTLALYPLLPGVTHLHLLMAEVIAAAAALWGLLAWALIPWRWVHPLALQATTLVAFPVIALTVIATGGTHSDCWLYLWFVGYFGFYFYGRPVALMYVALCIAVQALPLIYDPGAIHNGYLPLFIIASGAYAVVGCTVILGKERFDALRASESTRAAEHKALQRAATAAVGSAGSDEIYQVVAQEAAALLGASGAAVIEISDSAELTVRSSWSDAPPIRLKVGTTLPILPWGPFDRARTEHRTIIDTRPDSRSLGIELGRAALIVAPVSLNGNVWGGLVLATDGAFALDQRRATAAAGTFAALLAEIVTSLQERQRLASEAVTDPLTGIANRAQLDERLAVNLAAARRHGRTLTVAMMDLDNFKKINDVLGHGAGDEAIKAVAKCLRDAKRLEDTVGRFGGDEFMWIMPDTNSSQALNALQRARVMIGRTVLAPGQATSSGGVCDTTVTSDPTELVQCADTALYASKQGGRDRVTIYDEELRRNPTAGRDEWHERSQAIDGLRALARAIDAKDPATREHSERVAAFAGHLAAAAGWSQERIARLREAALVHDVGKLGVPDAILTKPGRLTERERIQMNEHVELSARIVGSVLTAEQVGWIRAHHERPDGLGYPNGLIAADIPEGAALIALADSWDVMVIGRTYNRRKETEAAYSECVGLLGAQFTGIAINALEKLHAAGRLEASSLPGPLFSDEPGSSLASEIFGTAGAIEAPLL